MRKRARLYALGLAMAMVITAIPAQAKVDDTEKNSVVAGFVNDGAASGSAASGSAVTGPAVEPTTAPTAAPTTEPTTAPTAAPTTAPTDPTPVPDATEEPTDPNAMHLNHTSVNKMAGKSFKLTVKNITPGTYPIVSFTSSDETIAKVEDAVIAADQTSASATIKLLKAGKTWIDVDVNGEVLDCTVKVVAKFSKSDFGGYRPKNFVTECSSVMKKKKYTYYFDGEWGKPSKYGSTHRGVKIGMSQSKVEALYGELNLKACKKSKDPFLYDYQFNTSAKKLKVSKYANFSLKTGGVTYNLRIYFTKKKKVFGFIMLGGKGFSKISKTMLKKAIRSIRRPYL